MIKILLLVLVMIGVITLFSKSQKHPSRLPKTYLDSCPDIGQLSNRDKQQQNLLKNRECIPRDITKEFLVDTIENVHVTDTDYIRAIGYLVKYKWEGPESCNCFSLESRDFEEHIYLSSTPDEHSLANTFVCEITRKSSSMLRSLMMHDLIGMKVAVEGYAFVDPDHINSKWRKSLIEVHPVVNIKVVE